MENIGYIIVFVYLLGMAVCDIRKREIQLGSSAVVAVLLAAQQLYRVIQGEASMGAMFSGVIVGGFLIIVSVVTRGQIGIGDGILFIISGLLLGVYENGILLFLSLVFTAVISGILILFKRVGRKYTIPFAPFVLMGYGVMCLWKIFG